ncbi:MAG TPA: tRNA (5-methylaminomethyl-2-thiouridine)(34)-methyltransferase MnmD [Puia sp.]|nr:tRNA (5-methylaminomethyl-2-thiouridine)(34)-methyltransferase MnmD [Puia sp.]
MRLKLIVTEDGSHSIEGPGGLTYHSTFGALQESRHIFLERGLRALIARETETATPEGPKEPKEPVRIFEMGLGAGLNVLLSLAHAIDTGRRIEYEAVETAPLPLWLTGTLNYCRAMGRPELQQLFEAVHTGAWETKLGLHPAFALYKTRRDVREHRLTQPADIVFYDAFDPAAQPELWTAEVFARLYRQMNAGAVLVTYCCKGEVQRAMRSAGFYVEKLPGPPGKREMIRAWHARPVEGS